MNRSAFAPAATLLFCSVVASTAFAQAQSAAPTTPAPAAKAKFATPIKGDATIQVIPAPSKFVGTEIVTVYKVKNTSPAPIALLKVDQYWYDDSGKMVSSDTQRYKQPLHPGEIAEITTRAPATPGAKRNVVMFSHANGKVNAKAVKTLQ